MIRIYTCLFFCLVITSFCFNQTWSPYDGNTFHLYEDPSTPFPKEVKMISFRTIDTLVDQFHFSGYLEEGGDNATSSVCGSSWTYYKLTHPWYGSKIICHNNTIDIVQASLDTLHFDFSANQGDTLWVFSNSSLIYAVCNSVQEETLLNYTDTIKRFTLHHEFSLNNPIAGSILDGHEMVLGKQLGFLTYFYLNKQNEPEEILSMIGNKNLSAGKFSLSQADCYYFPIGTEYQVKDEAYPIIKHSYYQVTNFVDNPGNIQLTVDRTTRTDTYNGSQIIDTLIETEYDVVQTYYKGNLIPYYLHNSINQSHYLKREIFCNDTIFSYSRSTSPLEEICYEDSIGLYRELDPNEYIISFKYAKYQTEAETWTPVLWGGYKMEKMTFLNNSDCIWGEMEAVGLNEIITLNTTILPYKISEHTYKFKGQFDKLFVFNLTGNSLSQNEDGTFKLEKNTLYLVSTCINSKWSNFKCLISE